MLKTCKISYKAFYKKNITLGFIQYWFLHVPRDATSSKMYFISSKQIHCFPSFSQPMSFESANSEVLFQSFSNLLDSILHKFKPTLKANPVHGNYMLYKEPNSFP